MSKALDDLVEHAMEVSRERVTRLTEPDEDILPALLCVGPHGLAIMPLTEMRDEATKDQLALWMTATLAVTRAEAAVMVTTAWMVGVDRDDPTVDIEAGTTEIPASERPDRTENIVLMCSTETDNGMVYAQLTRYPDKPPTLGEWTDWRTGADAMGGRFGDAIELGLRCVREMPPEMVEMIEAGWELGTVPDLITRFVKVAATYV